MLVLGREYGQKLFITVPPGTYEEAQKITVIIAQPIHNNIVRIGISAPREFAIVRDNAKLRTKKEKQS